MSKNKNFFYYNLKNLKLLSNLVAVVFLLSSIFGSINIAFAAGSLSSVKDTLANSRPSVKAAITIAITAGDTTISVINSNGFQPNDTITIKDGATTETKIIGGILSPTQLSLTVGTSNSYTTSGFVYFKSTSKHTITFNTRSIVSNGKFVVTLPGDITNVNDGLPDSGGFDFGGISTSSDISLSGFSAGITSTSSPASNLVFTFPFTGSLASNTAITLTIGTNNALINPTKTAVNGTADTSQITVDEQDSGSNSIDNTKIKVATIEAVGVSATISTALSFTISGVASGINITGYGTSQSSTSTTVPFSTLSVGATSTIAQYLHIDTSSNSGYIVTVQQDGSLRKTNGATIVDFDSSTTQDNENTTGFGYSLANRTNSDAVFLYNNSGTFNGRGFSSTTPFTIMSNSGPVSNSEVYVLYRIKINSNQPQGDYKNVITYIATANY